jgi:23S rRNA (cytosine1962-C5)-methyltransferase
MLKIRLKKGSEKPLRNGHPWIFSGALHSVDGEEIPGALCAVYSFAGELLGYGSYNQVSSIRVRMLSFGAVPFQKETLMQRMIMAVSSRKPLIDESTNSIRLLNSEGDFLPGIIIDKFSDGLVIQILTAGMELFREEILQFCKEQLKPAFIFEKSDTDARQREGLTPVEGLIYGSLPDNFLIKESGLHYSVDIGGGQKTGFFFDQRINRQLVRTYANGKEVCDCFCYSGGFTVNALAGNASHVTSVDISQPALKVAQANANLNGFTNNTSFVEADIFKYLREIDKNSFDLIILDPPKFARHAGEVQRAARGYKDINLQALKKIRSGGILFTFSCSGAVDRRLFSQIIFSAAVDSQRQVQVLHTLSAGPDHPFNITHQEGEYLKGLVVRVS